jgi:serine phosphatase RsbU (regulator of sigma subunit)
MRSFFALLFLCCFSNSMKSKENTRDSLKHALAHESPGKHQRALLSKLCIEYAGNSVFDTAEYYAAQQLHWAELAHDTVGLASAYNNKGLIHLFQSDNAPALDFFLHSFSFYEKLNDSTSMAAASNCIGIVYLHLKEYEKALDCWRKCMLLDRHGRETGDFMDYYGNIGSVFVEKQQYDSALVYLNKALTISEAIKDNKKTAISLQNIGDVLIHQKKYKEALGYNLRSLEMTNAGNQNYGLAGIYINLGLIYKGLGDYPASHTWFDKSLAMEKESENIDEQRQIYEALSNLYSLEKEFSKAYASHLLYTKYNDSIYSRENLSKASDLKAAYEIDKRERQLKQDQHEKDLKQAAADHSRKIFETSLMLCFAMLVVVSGAGFRSYRIKKNANDQILKQKNEIGEKNTALLEANKQMSDSIQYARRIQDAILPAAETIAEGLPDSFVLYLPRNVVSGDFYFYRKLSNGDILLACCDCTGHGVPGAFMSMIGSEQLGKIVSDKGVVNPAAILNDLHQGMRRALQQDQNGTQDGMDLAIVCIGLKTGKLQYAGANRPLWMLRKGDADMLEIKANKQAVGGSVNTGFRPFTNHEMDIAPGDRLYLFSDGYADQFGGERGRKFMTRQFQTVLLSLAELPMAKQRVALQTEFESWKGSIEQVDDVLVIGIRI